MKKAFEFLMRWLKKFEVKTDLKSIEVKAPSLTEHITEETGGYEKSSD